MPKSARVIDISGLKIDRRASEPVWRQIYSQLRSRILSGVLRASEKLPAHRMLADQLKVSRATVVNAYEQLQSEGFIISSVGSGSIVAAIPEVSRKPLKKAGSDAISISKRIGEIVDPNSTSLLTETKPVPFRLGTPDFVGFPHAIWRRLLGRYLNQLPPQLLMYSNTAGYQPLRKALADYLRRVRGVNCDADQIVITSGAQQAIYLAALLTSEPGDTVWVENPGYRVGRSAFKLSGLNIQPVTLDSAGLNVQCGRKNPIRPRLMYVTPSHQYPLGITMSIERRLELLEHAEQNDAVIIEDDYVSEFRYEGAPIPSLQGLDERGRVIYIGTFSKVFFPALRIGFAVLPKSLVPAFVYIRSIQGVHSSTIEHAALASFLSEGHFDRHLHRMRIVYKKRRDVLRNALDSELPKGWAVTAGDAGLHLVLRAPGHIDDKSLVKKLAARGIEATALSRGWIGQLKDAPKGLMLGFSGFSEQKLRSAAKELLALIK